MIKKFIQLTEIEAVQYKPENLFDIIRLCGNSAQIRIYDLDNGYHTCTVKIDGKHLWADDWVVRESDGTLKVVSDEEFKANEIEYL